MNDNPDSSPDRFRIELDSLGEVEVPRDCLWGAQTQRAGRNFEFKSSRFSSDFVKAFALVKKAAAISNGEIGQLEQQLVDLISSACDEILSLIHI